jgi:Flp pilus assembly secretin CpaC
MNRCESGLNPLRLALALSTQTSNIQDDDRYLVTAMTASTEYHCVSRKDFAPYNCTRIVMDTGSVELPTGKSIFIGGGATNYGEGPIVVDKSIEDRQIQILTPVFGLIFW